METIVEFKNVSYTRNDKEILKDINFCVSKGDKIIILGENGSGKTTLLNMIAGDIKPNYGTAKRLINSSDIGVVYDKFIILPMLKVNEVLHLFCAIYSIDYNEIIQIYYDIFKLSVIENSYLYSLSMGERRRVSIMLALIYRPLFLIMDEPFSNVDPTIIDSLWSFIDERAKTIIYTSHNWSLSSIRDSSIYMMYSGSLKKSKYTIEELKINVKSDYKVICNKVEYDPKDLYFMYYVKDNDLNILGDIGVIIKMIGKIIYRIEEINIKDLYYINYKY
jgi:ABC-type multidrug transport system, ATPase component